MTEPAPVEEFDIRGPLPRGVTVLEASAGTGKTWIIAALAARYVAEGTPLERLLLVTFTRMATGELRDRVRSRFVDLERGLAEAQAGRGPTGDDDPVLALLADAGPAEQAARRDRLARALADFDAATIATTHGFCQHVLDGLGVAGDVERDVTFVEDLSELTREVVDDLYLRKFHWRGAPPFTLALAREIGRMAVDNPLAPIEPTGCGEDTVWAMRRRLALAVRNEVEMRKRADGLMTYEDLLTRLRGTLHDEVRGPAARRRLRERYDVALVDEFQDTDPVQWDIMRTAFGDGDATLVLVGDPKQAIYSFRGADVFAYLAAVRRAARTATLGVNWRTDQPLIDAYDALFRGAKLGHPGIAYRPVEAAPANRAAGLVGVPSPAPLRVRVVHRADGLVRQTPKGYVQSQSAREHIAADLAADLVHLLSSGAAIRTCRPDGATLTTDQLRPADVAVLVRTHRHAALVHDALARSGIPAVINGAGSVFSAPVAGEWLRLLDALDRPASPARARAAALTVFFGWTPAQVASADERAWDDVRVRLHQWATLLRRRGVAALLETVTLSERLPGRVLARDQGERRLTDLRHIGELLHAEATAEQLGTTALTAWLRERIAEAAEDTDSEDRSRRLESDAEAVQVLTIHRSKGLEFPVVYYPFLWDPSPARADQIATCHDPERGDERIIDVGGDWIGSRDHRDLHVAEERGEDLRLAYVALTRARHQAVLWWAGTSESKDSSLGRLLFCRDADGNVRVKGGNAVSDAAVVARFEELAASKPGRISVERSSGGDGASWTARAESGQALVVAEFGRRLDPGWRRTSYTSITAPAPDARVGSEPEEGLVADELPPPAGVAPAGVAPAAPAGVAPAALGPAALGPAAGVTIHAGSADAAGSTDADVAALRATPSPLAATPGGTEVGTFVHAVLEAVDFAAPDLVGAMAGEVRRQQLRRHVDIGDPALLVAGLVAAVETPLGPLLGGLRLRDVGRRDRLDELAFELPLVGGDWPTAALDVADLGPVLRAHLPAGDPLAVYADRLAEPGVQSALRGYLVGSLDLVLRSRSLAGDDRFAVVDYKTNWLGVPGDELSAYDYRPSALVHEMVRAHYPLQALLYCCALHRYLRWRLPGYDPERHLGGVLYLFIRGMCGPATPVVAGQPCGVFAWRPPAALVTGLSDLLDRGRSTP